MSEQEERDDVDVDEKKLTDDRMSALRSETKKPKYRYTLNTKTNIIHRNPSQERCNMDQSKSREHLRSISAELRRSTRFCSYCWP